MEGAGSPSRDPFNEKPFIGLSISLSRRLLGRRGPFSWVWLVEAAAMFGSELSSGPVAASWAAADQMKSPLIPKTARARTTPFESLKIICKTQRNRMGSERQCKRRESVGREKKEG